MGTSNGPINVAMVGCGHIGWIHAENIVQSSRFRLVAVCDVVEAEAKCMSSHYGIGRWCTQIEDVLTSDVEAVLILTPPDTHVSLAKQSLKADKHVFCEKPLAKSVDECTDLLAALSTTDRVFLVGYPMRFSRDAVSLRESILSGRIGRPVFFRDVWALCKGSESRAIHDLAQGGGVLFEHTHWLDFVVSLFGSVDTVYSQVMRLKPEQTTALDTFVLTLRFSSGDIAVWSESWAARGFGWSPLAFARKFRPTLDVIGPLGSIHFPDPAGKPRLSLYTHETGDQPAESWRWETDWGFNGAAYPDELDHFYSCVRHGEQPRCTARDATMPIRIVEAALESAKTGEVVRFATT